MTKHNIFITVKPEHSVFKRLNKDNMIKCKKSLFLMQGKEMKYFSYINKGNSISTL